MSRFAVGTVALCLAGLFTVAFSPAVHSEEPDSEVLQVKDVVVSSTRLPGEPVDARTLPAKVTIITADDIRKSGAKTVQEAIQWAMEGRIGASRHEGGRADAPSAASGNAPRADQPGGG